MTYDFENVKHVTNLLFDTVKIKLCDIKISKLNFKENLEDCGYDSRDIFIISITDSSDNKHEVTYMKDWFIGEESVEILDKCLKIISKDEPTNITIFDMKDNKLLQFEITLHEIIKATPLTNCLDSEICELGNHYKIVGNVYFKSGLIEKAFKNYSFSLKLMWLYYSYKYGSYEYSISKTEENTVLYDVITSLLLNISACQLKVNSYNLVIQNCSMIIKANPDCVKALYRRGKAYFLLGQLDSAYNDLKIAYEINPSDANIAKDFSELRHSLTKYEEDLADKMKKMFE